jgi:hypothetical protein
VTGTSVAEAWGTERARPTPLPETLPFGGRSFQRKDRCFRLTFRRRRAPTGGRRLHVAGHAGMIIDDATARQQSGPISTAATESAVQRPPHRRMGANPQMRRSPRGAHPMLKVRTAAMNHAVARDRADAETLARRPWLRAA